MHAHTHTHTHMHTHARTHTHTAHIGIHLALSLCVYPICNDHDRPPPLLSPVSFSNMFLLVLTLTSRSSFHLSSTGPHFSLVGRGGISKICRVSSSRPILARRENAKSSLRGVTSVERLLEHYFPSVPLVLSSAGHSLEDVIWLLHSLNYRPTVAPGKLEKSWSRSVFVYFESLCHHPVLFLPH